MDPRATCQGTHLVTLADAHDPVQSRRVVTTSVTCLGCGCLCDDLTVTVDGGLIVESTRACPLGVVWLQGGRNDPDAPVATIDGAEADLSLAVDRAVEMLARARAPVIFGLTSSSTETVRVALALADRLRGRLWLDRPDPSLARLSAFQNQGRVTGTLGEVKNRADVIVFWGCDPLTTHPRHWERYSVEPVGRFVPEGRTGRMVVVVDRAMTRTGERADLFVQRDDTRDIPILNALVASVRHQSVDPSRQTQAIGFEPAVIDDLVSRLMSARYGAIFFQPGPDHAALAWEEAARLVRALQDHTRFVLLGLGSAGNEAGAEAALTWQAGSPRGVDYGRGFPTPLEEVSDLDALVEGSAADLLLTIGPVRRAESNLYPAGIPVLAIGPNATRFHQPASTVAIAASATGIEAGGTVTRTDGVVLPLRPPLASRFPSELEVVTRLSMGVAAALNAQEPLRRDRGES